MNLPNSEPQSDFASATLVQQHLAAASLLLEMPRAELYMTTSGAGVLNVQVPEWVEDQQGLFRRVAAAVHATVITAEQVGTGRHLVGTGGSRDGVPVRIYAPLPHKRASHVRQMADAIRDEVAAR